MALDPAEFIADLDPAQPPGADPASQADDHIRSIKKAITQSWPGSLNAALNLSITEIEALEARIAALEGITFDPTVAPVIGQLQPTSTIPISVTGVGFQPAIVFMAVTVDQTDFGAMSMGATDGTFEACINTVSDVVSANKFISSFDTDFIYFLKGYVSNTIFNVASGTITSLDADGFTLDPINHTTGLEADIIWTAFK